jgi:hypothetical protein
MLNILSLLFLLTKDTKRKFPQQSFLLKRIFFSKKEHFLYEWEKYVSSGVIKLWNFLHVWEKYIFYMNLKNMCQRRECFQLKYKIFYKQRFFHKSKKWKMFLIGMKIYRWMRKNISQINVAHWTQSGKCLSLKENIFSKEKNFQYKNMFKVESVSHWRRIFSQSTKFSPCMYEKIMYLSKWIMFFSQKRKFSSRMGKIKIVFKVENVSH